MSFLYWLHIVIIIAIISIPFWPKYYLEYGIYIPAILSFIWLICDGCPISQQQTELNGDSFVLVLLKNIYPSITEKRVQDILTTLLITITLVSAVKLRN